MIYMEYYATCYLTYTIYKKATLLSYEPSNHLQRLQNHQYHRNLNFPLIARLPAYIHSQRHLQRAPPANISRSTNKGQETTTNQQYEWG